MSEVSRECDDAEAAPATTEADSQTDGRTDQPLSQISPIAHLSTDGDGDEGDEISLTQRSQLSGRR